MKPAGYVEAPLYSHGNVRDKTVDFTPQMLSVNRVTPSPDLVKK
jgi:hypothetical protein